MELQDIAVCDACSMTTFLQSGELRLWEHEVS